MKKDIPSTGSILAKHATTSGSLLYMCPQTLRSRVMAMVRRSPEDKAMHMATLVANFAAWGCPAPSSFDTRVLQGVEEQDNRLIRMTGRMQCLHCVMNCAGDRQAGSHAPDGVAKPQWYHEEQDRTVKAAESNWRVCVFFWTLTDVWLNYLIDSSEVSSWGFGRRPDSSTMTSNAQNSKLHPTKGSPGVCNAN